MNLFDFLPAELANAVLEFVSVDEPVLMHFETSVLPWIEKKVVAFSKTHSEWCSDCFRTAVSSGEQCAFCEMCIDEEDTGITRKMSFAQFEAQEREQIHEMDTDSDLAEDDWFAVEFSIRSKLALCGYSVVKNAYRDVTQYRMSLRRSHRKSYLIQELEAVMEDIPRWEAYELEEIDMAGWLLAKSSDVVIERVENYFADNVGAYLQVAEEACK